MGANPDKRESFNFYQLLRAVELRIIAIENAEQIAVLPEEVLNVQLIQELRQQRNKLDCRGEGRLLGPDVHKGALMQPQSPTTDQAAARGPAQGYGPAPEYEDWQSRTRPPQDSQYPQDYRYPQDFTAFERPQWGVRG